MILTNNPQFPNGKRMGFQIKPIHNPQSITKVRSQISEIQSDKLINIPTRGHCSNLKAQLQTLNGNKIDMDHSRNYHDEIVKVESKGTKISQVSNDMYGATSIALL